jgi:hypothetical protein
VSPRRASGAGARAAEFPRRTAGAKVPFGFVLDYLAAKDPFVRPMFGCHAVYVGRKIVLVLRQRPSHPSTNGVWLATRKEHHAALKKIFPSMRSIDFLGRGVTNWQVIPESADDFETSVLTACELIVRGDARIGTLPKAPRKR